MAEMSTFNVDLTVANLSQPARNRRVSAMVDTGATYTTLFRSAATVRAATVNATW